MMRVFYAFIFAVDSRLRGNDNVLRRGAMADILEFKKKKAIYRMGLYDQMEARFLEQVGDIKIYLVSFNDKSPIRPIRVQYGD